MSLLQQFQNWTSSHNPKWLALIRVAVGAVLLLFGVLFLNRLPDLDKMLTSNGLGSYKDVLMNAIPWLHIGGGFLMIIGLFTRFAAFVQIPLILGALISIHTDNDLFKIQTNIPLSIILLFLLIVFVIEGSGTLSLAHYFKEEEEEEAAME